MKKSPIIESVQVVGPCVLSIVWGTGENLPLDLSALKDRNDVFSSFSDPDVFASVEIAEWGHGLDWRGNIGMGADRLYELCREQAGMTTPNAFDAWMQRNDLSLTTAAQALGMTRRMIAHYRTGSKPIPKVVGLALKGLEQSGHA